MVREELDERFEQRERALRQSRSIIQLSSKSIRHVLRGELDGARDLLAQARETSRQAHRALADMPQIHYAGYLQDADKEMVEAAAMLALATEEPLPSCGELDVELTAYLNGLAEAASECRRYLLDRLRAGERETAKRLLERMEAVYDELSTLDYPDGMTGGLRRTCDALRAVIERTRSDLTLTEIQQDLIEELRRGR